MKKSYIVLGGIILFVLILFMTYRSSYNTAVEYKMLVKKSWGDVQSSYQRRADLIPGLMETVKGAAANEKDILTKVTNARAGITEINEDILNAKNPEQMEIAGKKINTAINLAFEAYPQIRSTENFGKFQDQLEGTENRIKKSRDDYNESIQLYNTHISGFLNSMFLNKVMFPYDEGTFSSSPGSDKAPEIKF